MRVAIVASLVLLATTPSVVFAQGAPSNTLTPGNVSLHLAVGKTSQAEVLEAFGSPNIVTQDGSKQEVWSYQKHATVTQGSESGAFFNILIAGAGTSKTKSSQTQRTMTLIIKFDANHIVSDFNSRASEF